MSGTKIRRVRVWFGPHLLCALQADEDNATAYAFDMPFRFHGVRVAVDDPVPGEKLQQLPCKQLWSMTLA